MEGSLGLACAGATHRSGGWWGPGGPECFFPQAEILLLPSYFPLLLIE